MTREEALTALGLDGDATQDEITAAYRELAQMLHPDKYGTSKRLRERAEQQMRVINKARDTLLRGRAGQDARHLLLQSPRLKISISKRLSAPVLPRRRVLRWLPPFAR